VEQWRQLRFVCRAAPVLATALIFSGCSGGGAGERLQAPQPDPNAPDVSVEGRWSEVFDWPLIPIHVTLLPDGRVFSFGTDPKNPNNPDADVLITGKFTYDIWTPGSGDHLTLPNQTQVDTFCAAQLVLPQLGGGVLVVGGDTYPRPQPNPTDPEVPEPFTGGNADSLLLDSTLDRPELRRDGDSMDAGRWYGSVTTLVNGETYVQGGESRILTRGTLFPEIRSTAGVYRRLNVDTSTLRYYYPRNFVAPDGRVFGYDTTGKMYYVDTVAETLTAAGTLPAANMGDDSTAAMFSPGRILQFGGESDGAIVIDINGATPQVSATADLSTQRRLATSTILANGQVLASGGSLVYNEDIGVNLFAETWDPVSGEWTLRAESAVPRLYHSSALLLADGSVLIGGGGAPGPFENLNAEIYYPPYLFDATGKRASRPSVSGVPTTLNVGRQFTLTATDLSSTPARVVLVKTGSETHGLNMEQRFVPLAFTSNCSGSSCALTARMPSRPGDVPPGYYLLFVLNAKGVPSVARFVFVNVAGAADPAQDPSLANPGAQDGTVGALESLALSGSDPNGTALRYAAAGLPPGLALNPTTGVIGGTPSAAGDYDVVVSASDGQRTASANFLWSIAAAP
jgi:hypothetical protein